MIGMIDGDLSAFSIVLITGKQGSRGRERVVIAAGNELRCLI
jgi:hypothetical protein